MCIRDSSLGDGSVDISPDEMEQIDGAIAGEAEANKVLIPDRELSITGLSSMTIEDNFFSALMILLGSTFYVIGGILTLKISHKKNENVTASILIWGTIIILPISIIFEQPWNFTPRLDSTLSLIYLGIFPTGIAWLLRFMILKNNGVVFQSQVAFLIPIFGVILGYIFLQEIITSKVMLSLVAVVLGIYFEKKSTTSKNFWGT